LGTLSHSIQCTALAIDSIISVALTQLAFGLTHGLTGIAELAHFIALALLAGLTEPVLLELLQQFVEAITQTLLILT
jgi:hypothetical protein